MADTKLRNPRRKKGAKHQRKEPPFPIPVQTLTGKTSCDERWFYYTGHFSGVSVVVESSGDIVDLYRMGFFGKGNLSRSKPEYDVLSNISQRAFSKSDKLRRLPPKERQIRQSKFREIRKERYRNHCKWRKLATEKQSCSVEREPSPPETHMTQDLYSDDSESESDGEKDFQANENDDDEGNGDSSGDGHDHDDDDDKDVTEVIKDVLKHSKPCNKRPESNDSCPPAKRPDPYPVFEQLHLSLEEAFFLSYGLGCLCVLDKEREMNLNDMWQAFCAASPDFLQKYIVYHYLRSKGWVPKTGLKYGTDYVIYKEGMPFYHSRPLTWCSLCGLSRVNEHAAKEVMICYVIKPSEIMKEDLILPSCIPRFKVQEVVMRRWIPERAREPDKP
ncbi:tRNA-splicing endonuclease subunit Sen2 isoform X2 [Nematostella vectensis]|uniref:tRNA-splicing endonuclease subunit Sen2 isoform X2 n=1 Tax=Nematostella vectensis TaxID=45351 RepID=UPI002076E163|nr:tRNA-splicing endonuclease subunit Sen2 isoform X2 [Nematostella vectensis]